MAGAVMQFRDIYVCKANIADFFCAAQCEAPYDLLLAKTNRAQSGKPIQTHGLRNGDKWLDCTVQRSIMLRRTHQSSTGSRG
jgi:hypothetical protein